MTVLSILLLSQVAAAIYLVYVLWRTRLKVQGKSSRWIAAIAGTLGMILWLCLAAFLWFDAGTRDSSFVCGRELVGTEDCPKGGVVYVYWYSCIAGSLKIQYGARTGLLPILTIWGEPEDPSLLTWDSESICEALSY